jgi:hypothetical protein
MRALHCAFFRRQRPPTRLAGMGDIYGHGSGGTCSGPQPPSSPGRRWQPMAGLHGRGNVQTCNHSGRKDLRLVRCSHSSPSIVYHHALLCIFLHRRVDPPVPRPGSASRSRFVRCCLMRKGWWNRLFVDQQHKF